MTEAGTTCDKGLLIKEGYFLKINESYNYKTVQVFPCQLIHDSWPLYVIANTDMKEFEVQLEISLKCI